MYSHTPLFSRHLCTDYCFRLLEFKCVTGDLRTTSEDVIPVRLNKEQSLVTQRSKLKKIPPTRPRRETLGIKINEGQNFS